MSVDATIPADDVPGPGGGPVRRVVFIGGIDDGRRAVAELQAHPRVDLVGAFVLGAGAQHVSGFRTFDDLITLPVLQKIDKIRQHAEQIRALRPDLIFVVGFSQIIPPAVLDIPPMGVIGFHSALLPGRRGCSPLSGRWWTGSPGPASPCSTWTKGIDTGDVIGTQPFAIAQDDWSADVIRKADDATIDLLRLHLDGILDGTAPRVPQDDGAGTYTRKRTPADGEIDWTKPAHEVVNLIRALASPYPVAHTFGGDGVPILIE